MICGKCGGDIGINPTNNRHKCLCDLELAMFATNNGETKLTKLVEKLKKENAKLKEKLNILADRMRNGAKEVSYLENKVDDLYVENSKLKGLLKEVTLEGKEDIDPRIDYYNMQFDKGLFKEIKKALEAIE